MSRSTPSAKKRGRLPSQKTNKTEFYATIDTTTENINDLFAKWQHYYNWERSHGAHKSKASMDCYLAFYDKPPLSEEAYSDYHLSKERIQEAKYKLDLELAKLKRSL